MTETSGQIDLETGSHRIENNEYVYSKFFSPAGKPIDNQMIQDHIETVRILLKSRTFPFFIDLSSAENVLSFDALKEWGQNESLNEIRIAEVYVVERLADFIFLKQHIRLNDLSYPAQVFQSQRQAKAWLKQFKVATPKIE